MDRDDFSTFLSLKQEGSVREYIIDFECCLRRAPPATEDFYINVFLNGLQPEVIVGMDLAVVDYLDEAMNQALWVEEKLVGVMKNWNQKLREDEVHKYKREEREEENLEYETPLTASQWSCFSPESVKTQPEPNNKMEDLDKIKIKFKLLENQNQKLELIDEFCSLALYERMSVPQGIRHTKDQSTNQTNQLDDVVLNRSTTEEVNTNEDKGERKLNELSLFDSKKVKGLVSLVNKLPGEQHLGYFKNGLRKNIEKKVRLYEMSDVSKLVMVMIAEIISRSNAKKWWLLLDMVPSGWRYVSFVMVLYCGDGVEPTSNGPGLVTGYIGLGEAHNQVKHPNLKTNTKPLMATSLRVKNLSRAAAVVCKQSSSSSLLKSFINIQTRSEVFTLSNSHSSKASLVAKCFQSGGYGNEIEKQWLYGLEMNRLEPLRLLNGDVVDNSQYGTLDWSTWLGRGISAGLGLAWLHHELPPPFMHQKVAPIMILVDDVMIMLMLIIKGRIMGERGLEFGRYSSGDNQGGIGVFEGVGDAALVEAHVEGNWLECKNIKQDTSDFSSDFSLSSINDQTQVSVAHTHSNRRNLFAIWHMFKEMHERKVVRWKVIFGEYWKNLRRITATHSFNPRKITRFEGFRLETGVKLREQVKYLLEKDGEVQKFLHFASLINVVMNGFGKIYDFDESKDELMLEDCVCEWWCGCWDIGRGCEIMNRMIQNGFEPNYLTHENKEELEKNGELMGEMRKINYVLDASNYKVVIRLVCKIGEWKEAVNIEMEARGFTLGINSFAVMVNEFLVQGCLSKACEYLEEMVGRGLFSTYQYGTLNGLNSLMKTQKLRKAEYVLSYTIIIGYIKPQPVTFTKPLTELLKKSQFFWKKDAQQAFIKLERQMTSAPVLETLEFSKELESEGGVSSVIKCNRGQQVLPCLIKGSNKPIEEATWEDCEVNCQQVPELGLGDKSCFGEGGIDRVHVPIAGGLVCEKGSIGGEWAEQEVETMRHEDDRPQHVYTMRKSKVTPKEENSSCVKWLQQNACC